MLTKLATFRGVSDQGEPLIHLFDPGVSMVKQAGEVMPVIKNWLDAYRPDPNKIAVLVNALGASEYWGQNVNGDVFPESALLHDCANHPGKQHPYDDFTGKVIPPYGAHTFMQAHPFVHHKNKDPNRAFGKVVLWAWNPVMHRVELIILLDKNLALEHGAQHVIDRIMAGEFPDVSMGCFPSGTKVTMADGSRRPIEDIKVGDTVLTHRGRARKVTELHRRKYKGDLYSIKAEAHPLIRCTRSHPFLAYEKGQVKKKDDHANWKWKDKASGDPEWTEASLLRGEYLVEPIRAIRPCGPYPLRGSRAEARLLGYYLAEGHLLQNKSGEVVGIELTTHKDDAVHDEIFDLCKEYSTKNPPATHQRANSKDSVGIYIFDCDLAMACLRHCSQYSKEKKLSERVVGAPSDYVKELIGAYANGDGCFYDGALKLSTASEDLAWQLASMLTRIEALPSVSCITHKAGSGFSNQDTREWVVHIGKQWSSILAPYCSKVKPVEILKSKNSRKRFDDSVITPIREISSMYVETDVFNFEVEEDNSYLVEGIAVHNCKVPYDICTICGHKSKTRKDYCNCIRFIGMNKILDDGRRIGVINTYPRFFDISFVFIGADKTAKVMCKLASGLWVPQSVLDAEELYGTSEDDGQLVKAASVQVPDNLYSAEVLRPPRSRGEIMDFYIKRAEPRIAGIPLAVSDRLLTGRTDDQENVERRAISDGTVPTNADVNETDEFPEPLMPSRGKTASALKQFIKESREKTALDYGKALQWADKNVTRTMNSPVGRSLVGAGIGGATGAGLSEDRLKGGLLGAGLGAAGALGLSEVTKRIGRRGGSKLLGTPVKKHRAAVNEIKAERAAHATDYAKSRAEAQKKFQAQGGELTSEQIAHYKKLSRELDASSVGLKAENQHFVDLLDTAVQGHKKFQDASQVIGGGVGALVGGVAGGGLGAQAFKEKEAADGLSALWAKCKKMKIGPPPKPNRKEYPFTGTIDFKGLMIHVENKPGSVREGKGWRTNMRMAYGEFLGTRGIDKDKLDVYVGPYRNAPNVYIIHQNFVRGPKKGKYDEDKVMVGFDNLDQAKAAYLAHYDSDKYFRSATVMAFPLFKRAILKKEVHGEKVASVDQSEYAAIMEKRAGDLRLEDLFTGAKTAGRRSKVWRHSDGRELKRNGSGMDDWGQVKQASAEKEAMWFPGRGSPRVQVYPVDNMIRVEDVVHSLDSPNGARILKSNPDAVVVPTQMKFASVEKYAALNPQDLLKVSAEKWADIVKHIGPGKAVGKVSPLLSDTEPSIPKDDLDSMSSQGMERALSTPSMMGMVLKPEEFQRICLNCMGKGDLADKMDDAGAVFKQNEGEEAPCQELNSDQLDPEMMKKLMPMMGEKSYLGPVVRRRIIRISIMNPEPMTKSTEVNSPLLSKVASAYNWYRREQMKLAADTMEEVPNNPELHSGLYGIGDEDLFGKTAMAPGVDRNTLAVVLGSIPITLMYSAHLRGKRNKGEEFGVLKSLVADHPWLATMGTAAGLRELMKNPKAKQFVSEIMSAGKRIMKGAPVPVAG